MRRVLLLVLVLGVLVGGAGIAQAHIQQFSVDAIFVDEQGRVTGVTGTITCTRGERFAINGEAFQGTPEDPRASEVFFFATGRCTGDRQRWFTDEVGSQTGPFTCGKPAGVHARAQSYEDRNLHDQRFFDGRAQVVCR